MHRAAGTVRRVEVSEELQIPRAAGLASYGGGDAHRVASNLFLAFVPTPAMQESVDASSREGATEQGVGVFFNEEEIWKARVWKDVVSAYSQIVAVKK